MTLLPRRPRRACRVCAADSGESDLCPSCRRDAADAARRKAAERLRAEQAIENEARRNREREAELERLKVRQAEEAERARQELLRRVDTERWRRESQATRVEAIGSPVGVAGVEDAKKFDPYAVLNLPAEVCQDQIELAYNVAKKRYDPAMVDFCSDEVKAHFKAKADALDRAYEMLVLMR